MEAGGFTSLNSGLKAGHHVVENVIGHFHERKKFKRSIHEYLSLLETVLLVI